MPLSFTFVDRRDQHDGHSSKRIEEIRVVVDGESSSAPSLIALLPCPSLPD